MNKFTKGIFINMLTNEMSRISEDCYCASWMSKLEYILWDIINGGNREYGQGILTQLDIDTLKYLSQKIGGWITTDGFIEMEKWIELYEKTIDEQNKLRLQIRNIR